MNTREGHSQFNPDPDSTTGGPPSMPSRIGPYEITREIGRGGMGVVYLARDTKLDRDVAIKALPPELADDTDRLARFEREAKVLAQLNHTNIAGIHGIEEQDGHKYLILEYVEGETLAERLDRGALPVDEALEIAIEIAAGVEAAHEAGIIHRDLKPDNIILTERAGQKNFVKVLDFGIAKRSGEEDRNEAKLTQQGVVLGTPPYMSPEQFTGQALDARSDVY
ncbi:MAG: serine/threonine protein kinase, partial [Planctomycetes bacterium]|nr:serine/threonine protein kinase [Planctomycetota bacterium]